MENAELLEQTEHRVNVDLKDLLDHLEFLGFRAPLELQADVDLQDQRDQEVSVDAGDHLELMVKTENQVLMANPDHQGSRDLLEIREKVEHPVQLEFPEQMETRDHEVYPVPQEHPDELDQLETQVPPEPLDHEEDAERRERKVLLVLLDDLVLLAP